LDRLDGIQVLAVFSRKVFSKILFNVLFKV
jgi:hypothetical protein